MCNEIFELVGDRISNLEKAKLLVIGVVENLRKDLVVESLENSIPSISRFANPVNETICVRNLKAAKTKGSG